MTELRFESYTMPAAELGEENPLPPLRAPGAAKAIQVHDSVGAEDREHLGFGLDVGPLPHRMQDGYGRRRRPRDFGAAVLENEVLRATFLLEMGGRLWSLRHKPSGRELLYVNPVFQPANLAVRNAWFSGGVEWNVGVHGHTPYTASPLFAARVAGEGGLPVLRMYEWDRIRQTPYQIDALLPAGSAFLLIRVRIVNPREQAAPMYWWSNMAVPQTPRTRVLAPADEALTHAYRGGLRTVPIPVCQELDCSYPANAPSARDYFYRVAPGRRSWIAALDEQGRGLVQTSTSLLKGRKLFVWGTGPGGRRWQEFLSLGGYPYLEIQAGLARTQMECLPMPAGASWSWLEAYGLMEADARAVHGTDWQAAQQAVASRLDEAIPPAWLEDQLLRTAVLADQPPEQVVRRGSGWGALELARRRRAGEKPFAPPGLVFDDSSLTDEQTPWLQLLERGEMDRRPVDHPPGAYMVQPQWRDLLERALQAGKGDHWLSWLHLGVMHYEAGRIEEACRVWRTSLAREPSAWAYRNLAVAEKHQGRAAEAAELWLAGWKLLPHVLPLAIETAAALLEADRPQDALAMLDGLPPCMARPGRLAMLEARAAVAAGQLDRAWAILQSPQMVVSDMREGEVSLSDLWFSLHEKRLAAREGKAVDEALRQRVRRELPPPPHLDFRMNAEARE